MLGYTLVQVCAHSAEGAVCSLINTLSASCCCHAMTAAIPATGADRAVQSALDFLLVVAFLTLNSVLNLTNKWALSSYGFRFPLLLTTCHMSFSFLALLPFMVREPFRSKHRESLATQWKGLVAIGIYMAANISLNNLSLVLITLSLNQVIR